MSEKQGKNSKSLFQKLTDMLNPQPGLTKEEKKRYADAKHKLEGMVKGMKCRTQHRKPLPFGRCIVTAFVRSHLTITPKW